MRMLVNFVVCLRYGSVQHIVLCFYLVSHRLVCSTLPLSLDYPFLIVPTVFSIVYLFGNLY